MRLLEGLLLGILIALFPAGGADARDEHGRAVIGEIAAAALPPQARDTLALIRKGGPFPYRKDGTVFRNRERRLPQRPHGYYAEYTVPTPGARDRGARRIIAGKEASADTTGGEYYYTDDHYETFRRIRP